MSSPAMNNLLIFLCLVLGLTVFLVRGQTPTGLAIGPTTVTAGSSIPITNVGAGGVSCPVLVLTNGMVTYTDPDINSVIATHTCNNGYQLSGGSTRTCDISSSTTWSGGELTCNIVDCGTPPTIDGGSRIVTTTTYQSTATYSCNNGYIMSGPTSVTCMASGNWSTRPTCIATCDDLPILSNGVITYSPATSPRLEGNTATHTCNTGYELSGDTVNPRVCQSDRTWSGGIITCPIVDCNTPPTINDGSRMFTTTIYQSTATYSCNNGYILTGSPTVTCLASGSWSTRPTCTATCDDLSLTNGLIAYSPANSPRLEGAQAIHICDTGYELSGGPVRVCQSDRSWSGGDITCLALGCPVGTYEEDLSTGESVCVPCPVNSISTSEGSRECTCFDGYFRTALEGSNFPCTSVPSACRHLQVILERTRATTITVMWDRPEIVGRGDYYYNIFYSEDNQTFIQHNTRPYIKQDAVVDYSLAGLKPLTMYTIRITVENGVSDQGEGSSCEVTGSTGDIRANAPSLVLGLCSGVVWTTPTRTYGTIMGYDLNFVLPGRNITVNKGSRELFHVIDLDSIDSLNTLVQVRAKTSGGVVGRWSELISLGCTEEMTCICP